MQSNQSISSQIEDVLVRKDAAGNYVYSKQEVRDFIVACVFELGLDVTPDIQGAVLSFLAEIHVEEDASATDILEHIRIYFQENPLPQDLLNELHGIVRKDVLDTNALFQSPAHENQARKLLSAKQASTQKRFVSNPFKNLSPRRGIRSATSA